MTDSSLPAFWAVIPAAGVGARMAADRPKQYLQLGGRTILEHSLGCFLDHPGLKGLVLSLAPDDPYWPTLTCASDSRICRVDGGAERADSVLNALLHLHALGAADEDWVLVHDAARPNLSRDDLDNLLAALADDPVGGLLAVPARDTLKRVDKQGRVQETVDRALIWQAYTPQMFRRFGDGVGRAGATADRRTFRQHQGHPSRRPGVAAPALGQSPLRPSSLTAPVDAIDGTRVRRCTRAVAPTPP